jgi:tetratricopeptide (TPR) repeat protein
MSEQYFNDILASHSTLKTPFWDSISDNLKACIAQTFPNDSVPEIKASDDQITSKLEAITELLKQTLAAREVSLAPTDLLRFRNMHALAMSYTERGNWEDGQKAYEHLIAESSKALGPDSKPELGAIFNLGGVFEKLGKYPRAEESYKKSLVLLESSMGKETPQFIGGLRGLVDVLAKQGKYDEADKLLADGQGVVEKMSGPFKEEEVVAMKEFSEKYQNGRK